MKVNMCADLVHVISKLDRNHVRRVKGGDIILHELVITVSVAGKVRIGVVPAGLGGILLNVHIFFKLNHIVMFHRFSLKGESFVKIIIKNCLNKGRVKQNIFLKSGLGTHFGGEFWKNICRSTILL